MQCFLYEDLEREKIFKPLISPQQEREYIRMSQHSGHIYFTAVTMKGVKNTFCEKEIVSDCQTSLDLTQINGNILFIYFTLIYFYVDFVY